MNSTVSQPSARARGFTLIELLAAVAIFSLLVGLLFQVVRSSLDVWSIGERGKESTEKSGAVLDQIAADLRLTFADSPRGSTSAPVRFVSDYAEYDFDLDRDAESVTQRLRFVRALPEERVDPRMRNAGDVVGATASLAEGITTQTPTLPTGGLAEVLYTTLATPSKGGDPARLMLVRALRTPIASDDSLVAKELPDEVKAIQERSIALAEGVLYLGFQFWSRDTIAFDAPLDGEGGPLSNWDSTRALLLDKTGANRFLLAKDESSLREITDDIFPRRVRVTMVIDHDADEAYSLTLESELSPTTDRVRVAPLRAIDPNAEHKFIKIGGEWIEWLELRGDELRVKRGARGSRPDSHGVGARVHVGQTFERTIEIPVFREDWNSR
jgi:prepilin-type N-terminal cleavage/methylation domain-containing protein